MKVVCPQYIFQHFRENQQNLMGDNLSQCLSQPGQDLRSSVPVALAAFSDRS